MTRIGDGQAALLVCRRPLRRIPTRADCIELTAWVMDTRGAMVNASQAHGPESFCLRQRKSRRQCTIQRLATQQRVGRHG